MSSAPRWTLFRIGIGALLLGPGCVPDAGRPDLRARAYLRVVEAEDVRPAGGPALRVLLDAARSYDPFLRKVGVRGLGRLERPELVDSILPHLDDPVPEVRAEAANALAQAVHRVDGSAVLGPLLRLLRSEGDPTVAAAAARSLGRLAGDGSRAPDVERALVSVSRYGSVDADPRRVVGATLGMESWTRRREGRAGAILRARILELTAFESTSSQEAAVLVRSLALGMAAQLGQAGTEEIARGLDDPADAVRAAAAAALSGIEGPEQPVLLDRALADASPRVRIEAIRLLASAPRDAGSCAALREAAHDEDVRAAILAVDALGRPCPDGAFSAELLERQVTSPNARSTRDWQLGAHALFALAAVAPDRARLLLPSALHHPNPFARAWAARAAGALAETTALHGLLGDADSNVATQAALALHGIGGPAEESALIEMLARTDDAQVIVTVAPLLEPTELRASAAAAAFATLARVSEPRWETLRDPRMALLDLIESVGDSARLRDVEPYLRDYDPAVARKAASVMEAWTSKRFLGAPRAPRRLPLPTPEELRAMERTSVVLRMARGGEIEIALLPLEAATNAFRLYSQARDGLLDGLTLHRVVPNFVVQGGSPRANEYGGHGAYTRDEVGLRVQMRGTVGVSTRGRDTGDGQIYVNLVDNARLDHDYTLLGIVVSGMDVVDRVLEGDVIEAAELRPR
jgi:cyclophilin family peptidyl-prolyl cis-trans isomerase/HEAT repeat protein